mmetsp:Transcript_36536/g.77753  ORF Transcript_36536/g.77753 Transcript_36536/m.77753 type:complete len:237 (+) Transcript_36536:386-1096(+)
MMAFVRLPGPLARRASAARSQGCSATRRITTGRSAWSLAFRAPTFGIRSLPCPGHARSLDPAHQASPRSAQATGRTAAKRSAARLAARSASERTSSGLPVVPAASLDPISPQRPTSPGSARPWVLVRWVPHLGSLSSAPMAGRTVASRSVAQRLVTSATARVPATRSAGPLAQKARRSCPTTPHGSATRSANALQPSRTPRFPTQAWWQTGSPSSAQLLGRAAWRASAASRWAPSA